MFRFATLKAVALVSRPHHEAQAYTKCQHLRKVAYNAADNKMSARNLALAFGATLIGEAPLLSLELSTLDLYRQITELIIEFAPEIFAPDD